MDGRDLDSVPASRPLSSSAHVFRASLFSGHSNHCECVTSPEREKDTQLRVIIV